MSSTACLTPAGPPHASPPLRAKCEGGPPAPSALSQPPLPKTHTHTPAWYKHTKINRYCTVSSCICRVTLHMNLVRHNLAPINTSYSISLKLGLHPTHRHTQTVQSSIFSAAAFRQNDKLMSMLE